ncbi:MAG: hypothetical protein BWZ01_01905 [Deltaproteobacteria bacterium ADurb.BinA179]|nr:MAG: hypothetical protein BWZ01_01905 [Deltaproteobacteria bacterium ADurb.BinA179]
MTISSTTLMSCGYISRVTSRAWVRPSSTLSDAKRLTRSMTTHTAPAAAAPIRPAA